jgi:hypothetical protein
MKHLLELGVKCLGRLVWRRLKNFHFFWRPLKEDQWIFLKCFFFFMEQLQSALSEHLISKSGRLQARSIVLSGCNILVKYLYWSYILLSASNTWWNMVPRDWLSITSFLVLNNLKVSSARSLGMDAKKACLRFGSSGPEGIWYHWHMSLKCLSRSDLK